VDTSLNELAAIPHSVSIPLGQWTANAATLDRSRSFAVHWRNSDRSSIAGSLLRRAGVRKVANIIGEFDDWKSAGLRSVSQTIAEPEATGNQEPMHCQVDGAPARATVQDTLLSPQGVPSVTNCNFRTSVRVPSESTAWLTRIPCRSTPYFPIFLRGVILTV
jgi:hypothetical protein